MKLKLMVLAAALVILGGGAVAWFAYSRTRHPHVFQNESEHGSGIDNVMGSVRALYHAPEGKTPCESAYNAFKNSLDVAQSEGVKAVITKLAPREDFLATCGALPASSQTCMVPRYLASHREECKAAQPPRETVDKMVVVEQRAEPRKGEVDQPGEPPPMAPDPAK